MEKVLYQLNLYIKSSKVESVESFYDGEMLWRENNDVKQEYRQMRFRFDPLSIEDTPVMIRKPVTDAIYITPPEYARDMVECGMVALGDNVKEIDFGDSAIGTGTLF